MKGGVGCYSEYLPPPDVAADMETREFIDALDEGFARVEECRSRVKGSGFEVWGVEFPLRGVRRLIGE
jgi:hypothetical protein